MLPMKTRIEENGCFSSRDILCVSDCETTGATPEDIAAKEQTVFTDNVLSLQQAATTASSSLLTSVSILAGKQKTTQHRQSNTSDTASTTENHKWNDIMTAGVANTTETTTEQITLKVGNDMVRKGKETAQEKNNEVLNEVTSVNVPNVIDGISELQNNGNTDTVKLTTVDNTVEDCESNEHNCQQHFNEETISDTLTITQKDVPLSVPHACHLSGSEDDVTLCTGLTDQQNCNTVLGSGEGSLVSLAMPATTIENDVRKQANGSNANTGGQQPTCEKHVIVQRNSIPLGNLDNQTVNCDKGLPSPNKHQQSSSNSFQSSCGLVGHSGVTDQQNVTTDCQDSNVTTIKFKQKQKNAKKKKGASRKKGRSKSNKKNMVDNNSTQVVIVPDSTGIQVDLPDSPQVRNSESVPITINGSTAGTTTETSVTSTTALTCMESSSNHLTALMHDGKEFNAMKKMKLEDNPITSPNNLVTSTSSDIIGNIEYNMCTFLGNDVSMCGPTSATEQPDASTMDDGKVALPSDPPSKDAGKAMNRRKHQKPKKRQCLAVFVPAKNVNDNIETNCNVNVTSPVDTSDATRESLPCSNEELLSSSDTSIIKFEPETYPFIPITKDRWGLNNIYYFVCKPQLGFAM